MRIRRLRMRPYGAFADCELEFRAPARPGGPGGLHLIFGPNGAGKTTTLEALRAVLYGMVPGQKAFRFPSQDLRLGAVLERPGGETLEFWRRTATKTPLWNATDDEPLGEERLLPYLGNLDRARFETLFGLDLATMVAGGEELLRGEGDIGRALFGAGLGGQRLAEVDGRLAEDLRGLYAERSSKARINGLLARHQELTKEAKRARLGATRYHEQRRELERRRKELAAVEAEPRVARREADRLERLAGASAALDPLTRRREERAQLGDVVPLDAETTERALARLDERASLAATHEQHADRLRELEAAAIELRARADADRLAAAERVEALFERGGSYLDAVARLADARAELEHARTRRDEALRLAGADGEDVDDAETLAAAASDGTLHELIDAVDRHRRALEEAETAQRSRRVEVERAAADVALAERALGRLEADVEAKLAADLRELEPRVASLAHLARTVPPEAAALEDHARETESLAAALATSRSELAEAEEAVRAGEAALAGLAAAAGALPPTPAELAAARARRDALLRGVLAGDAAAPTDVLDLERAVAEADRLADRLVGGASHAAERSAAEAALVRARGRARERREAAAAAETRVAQADARWRAAWPEADDFTPGPPALMRPWVVQRRALLAGADELRLRAQADAQQATTALAHRRAELAAAEAELRSAQAAWETWARARRLDPVAGPESARRRLRVLGDVRAAERDMRRATEQAEGAAATQEAIRAQVAELCEQLQVRVTLDEAALEAVLREYGEGVALTRARMDKLRRVVDDARRAAEALDVNRREAAATGERLEGTRARLEQVAGELDGLTRAAQLGSVEELRERASLSSRLRELDAHIASHAEQFLQHACGWTPEEVTEAVAGRTVAELREEAEVRRARAEELEADLGARREAIGQLASRVEGEGEDRASSLEAQLAVLEAELAEGVEAFLEARVARHLLDREVDRYRQETQGPLLARAQELFGTLTLGAYVQLHPSEERGHEVMVARRPDGRTVHVDGMSTGTRDQLYLALRIASVEHMLQTVEPMPFIADDLFVNFDDERTEAALRVLAELSRSTQVIVFSHHLSVVDTATRLTDEGVPVEVLQLTGEEVRERQES